MRVKPCPRCKKVKPVEEFNRKYDGYQPYCRECNRKYPHERLAEAESRFELIVLPGGIRCFQLKKEYL